MIGAVLVLGLGLVVVLTVAGAVAVAVIVVICRRNNEASDPRIESSGGIVLVGKSFVFERGAS